MHGAALLRATFPQSFLIPNALTMCGSAFPNQEECHQLQQQQKTFKNKRASSKNNTFSNLCQPRAMMCTHLPRNICQGTLGSSNFHLEQSLAQANVSSTLGRIWKGSPTLTHLGPSLQSISARELFQDLCLALQQIFVGHACPWQLRLLGRGRTTCGIASLLGILQCQPPIF